MSASSLKTGHPSPEAALVWFSSQLKSFGGETEVWFFLAQTLEQHLLRNPIRLMDDCKSLCRSPRVTQGRSVWLSMGQCSWAFLSLLCDSEYYRKVPANRLSVFFPECFAKSYCDYLRP